MSNSETRRRHDKEVIEAELEEENAPCPHEHQDVNDRNLIFCLDCNEELGR